MEIDGAAGAKIASTRRGVEKRRKATWRALAGGYESGVLVTPEPDAGAWRLTPTLC